MFWQRERASTHNFKTFQCITYPICPSRSESHLLPIRSEHYSYIFLSCVSAAIGSLGNLGIKSWMVSFMGCEGTYKLKCGERNNRRYIENQGDQEAAYLYTNRPCLCLTCFVLYRTEAFTIQLRSNGDSWQEIAARRASSSYGFWVQ